MPLHPATPVSLWVGFHLFLIALLAVELLVARRRANRPPLRSESSAHRTSVIATALWIAAALAFALFILLSLGHAPAVEYLAGYSIEEALSVDNLFVFLLLFRAFRIDPSNQPRVLFWGVAGAIVLRGLFISAGIGLLDHFRWISYVFGAILLIAAIRLLFPEKHEDSDPRPPAWLRWLERIRPISTSQRSFLAREGGHLLPTVLLLSLIAIELTDVVFALDSIPAVLSITRDPFLAYTSNIMAVMGLRSLFFLLAHLLTRLRYLHFGLAAVLAFAAVKMLAEPWLQVSPLASLFGIVGLLALTILASLWQSPARPAALQEKTSLRDSSS